MGKTARWIIVLLPFCLWGCAEDEPSSITVTGLLTANLEKTWQVTNLSATDTTLAPLCDSDDFWIFQQRGWRDIDRTVVIRPGFLKCDLDQPDQTWRWRFNSSLDVLHLISANEGDTISIIKKFDIEEVSSERLVLEQKVEDNWGYRVERITITLESQ